MKWETVLARNLEALLLDFIPIENQKDVDWTEEVWNQYLHFSVPQLSSFDDSSRLVANVIQWLFRLRQIIHLQELLIRCKTEFRTVEEVEESHNIFGFM